MIAIIIFTGIHERLVRFFACIDLPPDKFTPDIVIITQILVFKWFPVFHLASVNRIVITQRTSGFESKPPGLVVSKRTVPAAC
jgi:hypothetical protein